MIWLLLAGIVSILFYYIYVKPMSHWKNLGVKQSNPWPVVGDSWTNIFGRLSSCEFVEWVYNMYPNSRYSGFYQFIEPILVLRDPELIKQISIKDFDHFTDHRPFMVRDPDPFWDGNLFTLKGQRWREMRATLSGSYSNSKLKSLFHLIEEAAENFVQFFLDKNEDIIEIELKDAYTRYCNDVVVTASFGVKCDSFAEPNNEFYLIGKNVTSYQGIKVALKFIGYRILPKLFRLLKISLFEKRVAVFFKRIINEIIRMREEQGIVRPDMIHLLLEARKGIKYEEDEVVETGKESANIGNFKQIRSVTNDEIASQALIFFFAGFDTTSTGMCFGCYELATNKEVQDKLRDEIKKVNKKLDGKVTYDTLLKMPYLDMVMSEILRKWPSSTTVDRVCTKPYVIEPVNPDEKPVPLNVGDIVWIPIQAVQRDPNNYPNPDKFDPERFSDENKDSIKPYTYIPFGSGPRFCIGSRFAILEIKALLFNLLLNFEIVPTKKTQIPLKLNRTSLQHTAEGGFWVGLKRIKN